MKCTQCAKHVKDIINYRLNLNKVEKLQLLCYVVKQKHNKDLVCRLNFKKIMFYYVNIVIGNNGSSLYLPQHEHLSVNTTVTEHLNMVYVNPGSQVSIQVQKVFVLRCKETMHSSFDFLNTYLKTAKCFEEVTNFCFDRQIFYSGFLCSIMSFICLFEVCSAFLILELDAHFTHCSPPVLFQ